MKPPWLKLIEEWQDTGHFGLSIPFLYGALRDASDSRRGRSADVLKQLRALLSSVRDDAPEGVVMRLYSCDKLQDLALAKIGGIPQNCIPLGSPTRSEPALYVERGVVGESAQPFEELVETVWRRYEDDVGAGRFSRRAGAYRPFNDDEKNLILRAAARPSEDD